jgi:hypothetical protein
MESDATVNETGYLNKKPFSLSKMLYERIKPMIALNKKQDSIILPFGEQSPFVSAALYLPYDVIAMTPLQTRELSMNIVLLLVSFLSIFRYFVRGNLFRLRTSEGLTRCVPIVPLVNRTFSTSSELLHCCFVVHFKQRRIFVAFTRSESIPSRRAAISSMSSKRLCTHHQHGPYTNNQSLFRIE